MATFVFAPLLAFVDWIFIQTSFPPMGNLNMAVRKSVY